MPLGILATLSAWFIGLRNGSSAALDSYLLPLLSLELIVLEIVLWRNRIAQRYTELAVVVGVSLYQLGSLLQNVVSGSLQSAGLGTSAFWFPLTFLLAFLLLPKRWAFKVSSFYYLAALGIGAVGLGVAAAAPGRVVNNVIQFYVANFILLMTLNTYAYWRERHDVVQHLAHTDVLTNLPNRRYMQELLDETFSSAKPFAVLLLDIDHFKRINDEFSHATGDVVLHEVALRINNALRRSDTVARWGGEEFLVLASDTDLVQAQQLGERVAEAVRGVPFAGHIRVTLSVGVTCYKPGDTLAKLLSRADAALYRAKEAGRDRLDVIETTDAGLMN